MVESFFTTRPVVTRLRSISFSEILDELAESLRLRGYAHVVGQDYLRGAAHLLRWLEVLDLKPSDLTDELIAEFLDDHYAKCRCRFPMGGRVKTQSGLVHLMTLLRATGRVLPAAQAKTPVEVAIDEFRVHLRDVVGATEMTQKSYCRFARMFLAERFHSRAVDMAAVQPKEILRFVESKAASLSPTSGRLIVSSLRSFFRFAHMVGRGDASLARSVPTIRHWNLASVPKYLSPRQVRALLDSFDRRTSSGLRNYAIVLCLCRLGLRAGEVARLSLDDIDWRAGTIIVSGKSRRATLLPIPLDVGAAITCYLRRARPPTAGRHIFARQVLPVGDPIDSNAVRYVVRKAVERSGIQAPSKGSHMLRHTAATSILRAGASLKEVSDLLGHRSLSTTAIYAKVDLPSLAQVALPWPQVRR
jgi:site-specific recombinase XerD